MSSRIASCTVTPVNVPYTHREVSAVVERDGVTAGIVRLETEDGVVGWGETCSGSDMASVADAVAAMSPFVVGRDPFGGERARRELWRYALWQFREPTANFAWAGIDMALWDLCGKITGRPAYELLGGALRDEVDYFWYLSGASVAELRASAEKGRGLGYGCFYMKVGRSREEDVERVLAARDALGPSPRLRVDANGAWTYAEALRALEDMRPARLDFVEQPVSHYPGDLLRRVRVASGVAVAANEGLWGEEAALDRILADVADVYTFSPFWVGSLATFCRLGHLVERRGSLVCKHTHGELGIAASACQHALLALPGVVEGNQQTAAQMTGDVLVAPLPIASGPRWGRPEAPGLGVEVDEQALGRAAADYRAHGQLLPYQVPSVRHDRIADGYRS
ncbi:MAG: mandelate racemase/muconate lactonizing enzyme family protein [Actinomycetota bacterium]|nr:mandelate racemase/muconate lactonizing enzyme family protein [Actinomycetota bacterium]